MTTKSLSREQLIRGSLAKELVSGWSSTRGDVSNGDDGDATLLYGVNPTTGEFELSRMTATDRIVLYITPCEALVLVKVLKALYLPKE
jgi:hypothetical protein